MIRKFLMGILSFLTIFYLVSCIGPGALDWSYQLPNGYMLTHINPQRIVITSENHPIIIGNSVNYVIIEANIIKFCYNDNYVCIQQNHADTRFYILDTLEHNVHGPFYDESEYEEKVSDLGITGLSDWKATSSNPNFENN